MSAPRTSRAILASMEPERLERLLLAMEPAPKVYASSEAGAPSREDKEITRRLMQGATAIGVGFLDHLILCDPDAHYSFAAHGIMPAT